MQKDLKNFIAIKNLLVAHFKLTVIARTFVKVCLARYARATLSLLPDKPTTSVYVHVCEVRVGEGLYMERVKQRKLTYCRAFEQPHHCDGLTKGLGSLRTHFQRFLPQKKSPRRMFLLSVSTRACSLHFGL